MRVTHVIATLETGGAEVMLRRLAAGLQRAGVHNTVIALNGAGADARSLTDLGVAVHHAHMRAGVMGAAALVPLRRLLVDSRPQLVHTWMYHADLVAGLAAGLGRLAPVVWGVHQTAQSSQPLKARTRLIRRLNGALSWYLPARIICCAQAAKASHERRGWAGRKMVVIPNGFDTETFRPDAAARLDVRQELGLTPDAVLVGLMARFHPQKDHRTFVRAAARLLQRSADVHFLLAGRGVKSSQPDLGDWIESSGRPDRFHVLGERADMPRLMAACDVVTSSSASGEALPLVLGEAMSCGVPCVTTDVGDSAALVGPTGRIIAPADAEALAAAWESLLALPLAARLGLGADARARVIANYEIGRCVQAHLALYDEVKRSAEERLRA